MIKFKQFFKSVTQTVVLPVLIIGKVAIGPAKASSLMVQSNNNITLQKIDKKFLIQGSPLELSKSQETKIKMEALENKIEKKPNLKQKKQKVGIIKNYLSKNIKTQNIAPPKGGSLTIYKEKLLDSREFLSKKKVDSQPRLDLTGLKLKGMRYYRYVGETQEVTDLLGQIQDETNIEKKEKLLQLLLKLLRSKNLRRILKILGLLAVIYNFVRLVRKILFLQMEVLQLKSKVAGLEDSLRKLFIHGVSLETALQNVEKSLKIAEANLKVALERVGRATKLFEQAEKLLQKILDVNLKSKRLSKHVKKVQDAIYSWMSRMEQFFKTMPTE